MTHGRSFIATFAGLEPPPTVKPEGALAERACSLETDEVWESTRRSDQRKSGLTAQHSVQPAKRSTPSGDHGSAMHLFRMHAGMMATRHANIAYCENCECQKAGFNSRAGCTIGTSLLVPANA